MRRFIAPLLMILAFCLLLFAKSHATVTIDTQKLLYNCDGVITDFAYTWQIYQDSDLVVVVSDSDYNETTLILNTDYTVADTDPGGTVTLLAPEDDCITKETLVIYRDLELTQETDYVDSVGETVEDALDKNVLQIQDLSERVDRAFSLPVSLTLTGFEVAPVANKGIGFNANADGLTTIDCETVSVPQIDYIGNYASFEAAMTGDVNSTLIVNTSQTLTSSTTVPVTKTIWFTDNAELALGGYTITVNGNIMNGPEQIFSGDGGVVYGDSITDIFPEWHGVTFDGVTDDTTNFQRAVTAAEDKLVSLPARTALLSSTISFKCDIIGRGGDQFSGLGPILKYTGTGACLQNDTRNNGARLEGFRIDMTSNTNGSVYGILFNNGMVGGIFRNLEIKCNNSYDQNGMKFIGGDGAGNKYDVSFNRFDNVFITYPSIGIWYTDPDTQAAGGESTFTNCFILLAKISGYSVTGRGNTWIGGDSSSATGGTMFNFPGVYSNGQVMIGQSVELSDAADYAVTIDASNNSASSVFTWIGGKIYTGSLVVDNGVGTKKRRYIEIGDEDSLSGIETRRLTARGMDALTTTTANWMGIWGNNNDEFLQIAADDLSTGSKILLGTAQAVSPIPASSTLVLAGAQDKEFQLAYTGDGITIHGGTRFLTNTITASGMSGATVTLANALPASSLILGVSSKVTTLITGATSWDLGPAGDTDRYGDNLSLAAGSTFSINSYHTGTTTPFYNLSTTDLVATANGSNFTAGAISVIVHYILLNHDL